jgi:hypothetical protein
MRESQHSCHFLNFHPKLIFCNTALMIILIVVKAVKCTTNRTYIFFPCTTYVTLVREGLNSDLYGIDDCTKTLS